MYFNYVKCIEFIFSSFYLHRYKTNIINGSLINNQDNDYAIFIIDNASYFSFYIYV